MATTTKTEGREAVERAYYKYLRDIARFQCQEEEIQKRKDDFKRAVLSNPEITKEDIVGLINDCAFGWSSDGKSARAAAARSED